MGKARSWKTNARTIAIIQARDYRGLGHQRWWNGVMKRWVCRRCSRQALHMEHESTPLEGLVPKWPVEWSCYLPRWGKTGQSRNQGIGLGHTDFEMSIPWSSWDVHMVKYWVDGFDERSGLDKHLRVFGIYIVFKAIGKILKEMSTEKRNWPKDGACQPFEVAQVRETHCRWGNQRLGTWAICFLVSGWDGNPSSGGLTLKSVLLTP